MGIQKNMKVLVLAEKYSTNEKISQGFIHTRNCEYIKNDIDVDVISFSFKNGKYNLDGIDVYSLEEFYIEKNMRDYDIVISHAPNVRNHCKFINKNYNEINKLIFFFHGHEVLYSKEVYPKPYDYVKKENKLKETVRDLYDIYKVRYMSKFLKKTLQKSTYIFVSEWMYEQFKKNIKLDETLYKYKSNIVYNALGKIFLENYYDINNEKKYDFITVRNMLDGSKYCINVVNELAKNNPNNSFLVVGQGDFFKFNEPAKNLTYELKNLTHSEIINYLNMSKCALMPTKADAQGVMMCEMATFGIPVITSDIYVCRKVLGDLDNVRFIKNDNFNIDLGKVLDDVDIKNITKSDKFSYENTILKEVNIFKNITNEGKI